MLLRTAVRRAVAAAVLAAACCCACSEVSPAFDAATDAGTDARVTFDASSDAAADATAPDATASDAGTPSIDIAPGWVRLEGFAQRCRFERATDPAPLLDVRWEPCPFDTASCSYLAWDPRFAVRRIGEGTSDHDGTHGYFVVVQLRDDSRPDFIHVVADTDGRVYAAWRNETLASDSACLARTSVGDGRVVHVAEGLGPRPGTELLFGPHRVYWSDLETASDGEHLVLSMGDAIVPPGNSVDWLQTSDSLVAMRFNGAGSVLLFDGANTALHGGRAAGSGVGIRPRVVGDRAFWLTYLPTSRQITTAGVDGASIALIERDEVLGVHANASDIAWQQVVERDMDGTILATELWTTPLTNDPAQVRGRQVGRRIARPPSGGAAVGAGLYAYYDQDQQSPPYLTTIYVIDLADGSRRRYDLPVEPRWNAHWVEWVSRDEVGVAGAGRLADGSLVNGTIMRIRLSAFVAEP